MRTAYVLVDPLPGPLYAMTWISIQTLKRHHPDWPVFIYADPITLGHLRAGTRFANCNFVACDPPNSSSLIQSRWIKTRLISWLSEETLYLDSDTLVLQCLDGIKSFRGDFLAVIDWNDPPTPLRNKKSHRDFYERMNWPIGEALSFNSGVWVARPCDSLRRLGELWPKLWEEGLKETPKDQPSLWSSIHQSGVNATPIPNCWNASVMYRPKLMKKAKIAHFWRSASAKDSLLDELVEETLSSGALNWNSLDRASKLGLPWRSNAAPWQYARSGHWNRAVMAKLSILLRRANRSFPSSMNPLSD